MVSGIEGVGEAVTGGMIARAVEPGSGEADEGHTHEQNCLNCGAALTGPYCWNCGQKAHIHRTLTAFFHDLVHGVLHVEGKIWRTLPMLAFRPGELTRRYIDGERARFVSPMALFLFSVFLMFAVFSTVGGPVATTGSNPVANEMLSDFERETLALRERRSGLERQRRTLVEGGLPTAAVDAQIAEVRGEIAAMDTAGRIVAPVAGQQGAKQEDVRDERRQVRGPPSQVLNENNVDTGWARLDRAILKASDNPTLFMYKVQTNAYKFSWALIPISVPFVWLLFFWRRRLKVYDHTVFVTYSLAFMTLLTVLLSLLLPVVRTDAVAGFALLFIPPVHMYKQLKGTYELGRFRALWRTVVLLWFASIAATLFFLMLLTLGALG